MKKIFLTLLLAITSLSTFAQATFQEVTGTTFDSTKDGSFAFADIDNDNDNDLLITGLNSSNQQTSKLYTNDGNGNFSLVSGTPFDGVIGGDVSFADVDNDNDQDVLITGLSGTTYTAKLYINNGSGSFTLKSGTPFTGVKDQGSIAFADIDNDNDLDVLITGWRYNPHQAISELYTNDGNGNFNLVIGSPFNGVRFSSIAFADIDNDNDQDLLITGLNSVGVIITKLYTNDGNGAFTEVIGTPFEGVTESSIAFADVDNDNDQDLVITGRNSSNQKIAKLYTNDGGGTFTEVTGTPFDGVYNSSIAFADVDGDNDQDLVITGKNNSSQKIAKLYINNGSGVFTVIAGAPFDGVSSGSIAFADVDGDNDQDIVITGFNVGASTKLYKNNGSGIFTAGSTVPWSGVGVGYSSIAFTDIDNDNDQDLLITGGDGTSNSTITKLYTNNGNGTFTLVTGTSIEGVQLGCVAFADIDGDNDQDLFIQGSNLVNQRITKYYTNDGNGVFTEVKRNPFLYAINGSISIADIDGDNDQDVFMTGINSSNQHMSELYVNDGVGNFTLVSGAPFDVASSGASSFVDVDGDNDQDLIITGTNGSLAISKLYINDGVGNYTIATGTPFIGVYNSSIACADVDGDNDQDIFIMGESGSLVISNLYLNDGNGNFIIATGSALVNAYSGDVAFTDIDGDNDQDILIVGNDDSNQSTSKLYTNDGIGNFTLVSGMTLDAGTGSAIAFADVDGDNDQDLVISRSPTIGPSTKLYINSNGYFNLSSGSSFTGTTLGPSVTFSDIDNDDDQDLLITGRNSSNQRITELYVNNGNGNFTLLAGTPFDGIEQGSGIFLDVDGDNDQDVLISGTYKTAKLYENICHTQYLYEDDTICKGDNYVFPDGYITNIYSDTTYSSVFQAVLGCDSIIVSNVYIAKINVNASLENVCDTTSLFVEGSLSSYTWSNGVQNGVSFTPPDGTTTYYVSATTVQGCNIQDSITINKADEVYTSGSAQIVVNGIPGGGYGDRCEGVPVTLHSNYDGTNGWGNEVWISGVTEGVPFIPTPNNTYYYYITHPFGCVDTSKIVLGIFPKPNVTIIASSTTLCEGDEITLTGTGADGIDPDTQMSYGYYSWDNGILDNAPFIATTSGSYNVVGSDNHNCKGSSSIYITVNPKPTPTVDPFTKDPMCLKDSPVPLPSAYPSGGMFYGIGASNTNSSFNPDWAGVGLHTIDYEYTDANGCEGQASVDIEVIESPDFSYSTNDLSVSLTANNICSDFFWDFGDGNTNSFTTTPAYTYFNPGTYSVCLICNDIANCVNCIT